MRPGWVIVWVIQCYVLAKKPFIFSVSVHPGVYNYIQYCLAVREAR